MPRISDKERLIRDLETVLAGRLAARQIRNGLGKDDPTADALDSATCQMLCKASNRRYVFGHTTYRKGDANSRFDTDLSQDMFQNSSDSDSSVDCQPWLNDNEFLQKYRMSRDLAVQMQISEILLVLVMELLRRTETG
jgi:hypothetical protein